MSDDVKFKCEKCSKLFEPDPEMVFDSGIITPEDYQLYEDENQEWKNQSAPVREGAIFLCAKCWEEIEADSTTEEGGQS